VSFATVLANWKYIAMGALSLACAVLFGLWKSEEAAYANYKTKQAIAVLKAQERADSLANELVIQQAIAMGQTEKVVIEYRTQLRNAPDDTARLRAVACGLRDLTSPRGSPRPGCPPDAVRAPSAVSKPR
jgi:hypothetical protein